MPHGVLSTFLKRILAICMSKVQRSIVDLISLQWSSTMARAKGKWGRARVLGMLVGQVL